MRAKICGITNLKDALFAAQNGAWALGFNFYSKSPRYITEDVARFIIAHLPPSITKVGIFIGESYDFIICCMESLGLDLAQVYGHLNTPCSFQDRMILSLSATQEDDLPSVSILKYYKYILLDAPRAQDGLIGGTGRLADWNLAGKLARDYNLILAGGLNPDNVGTAINIVKPYAVDIASGIEKLPGIKDQRLIRRFMEVCGHGKQ